MFVVDRFFKMYLNVDGQKPHAFTGKFPSLEDYEVKRPSIFLPFDSKSTFSQSNATPHECIQYDNQTRDFVIQQCPVQHSIQTTCFAVWHGQGRELFMGCWDDPVRHCPRCDDKRAGRGPHVYFCCCAGNRCNAGLGFDQVKQYIAQEQQTISTRPHLTNNSNDTSTDNSTVPITRVALQEISFYFLLFPAALFVVILVLFAFKRLKKQTFAHLNNRKSVDLNVQIKKLEKVFTSEISTVWKGHYQTPNSCRQVAIKVTNSRDMWENEKKVYTVLQFQHKNILKFIRAEKRSSIEYWLITEYHQRSSLRDHLEAHTLSYHQMLKVSLDIAQGLVYLHSPVDPLNGSKPIVAHRDLKSRNVLLKCDLSACIADFGMSLLLRPNQPITARLSQVGTPNYMAPEYLNRSIEFSVNALLQIDIYACAMVFWEMTTRCSSLGRPVERYMTPFERELGKNADLDKLREYVTEGRNRPQFPAECDRHQGLNKFCRLIRDCWGHDAYARFPAACLEDRLLTLRQVFQNHLKTLNCYYFNFNSL